MKISQFDRDFLLDMANKGASNRTLCTALKMPISTISYWKKKFRENGLLTTSLKRGAPRRIFSPEDVQKCIEMLNAGLNNAQIAKSFNCSIARLLLWKKELKQNNIVLPDPVRKGRPRIIKTCPHCKGIL